MKKSNIHNIIAILLAIVMSLTSTGFTMIVGYCSMSKSSSCCCGSGHSSKTAAPSKAQTIVRSIYSCNSEKIIGGLHEIRGIVPENITFKISLAVLEAITPDFQNSLPTTNTLLLLPLDFRDVTPSKSDIYIQVSSFLI
jgi:hypothetical protein